MSYVYDASGRRIEKKYDGNTQLKYVYDGDHCIAEYDGSSTLLRKYVYGPSVDDPICMIAAAGGPMAESNELAPFVRTDAAR